MSWLDALLGRVFSRGTEVELAGGIDFQAPLTAIRNAGTNRVEVRCSVEELSLGIDVVRDYGADPTGATDSTVAIQAAIDAAAAVGGGVVYAPAGTYIVHMDPADYSEDPSDRRVTALVVRSSGVRIVGAGIGVTTIRCSNTDGAYGVIEFAQLPIENGIVKLWDCAVRDITLDGNRDSAAEPTNRASVLNFKGTARLEVEHVQVVRSAYYGIGFQNGGFQQCRVHHVLIENVGADGIDIKDSGAISEAFDLSDVWIKNFGRLTDAFSFAGLDVASLAPRIRGIHITGFGAEGSPGAGLRLKQGTDLAARGWGPQWAVVSDVIVEQTSPTVAGVQGVRINSGLIALSNVHVNGVTGIGIRVEQSHVRASNVLVNGESSATGIYLRARSLAADEQPFEGADDCVFSGVTVIGCARGIHNSRLRNRFSAVKIHDCATGVYGDSAIAAMAINGIDFSGAVTTPWDIGGTRHQITDVFGAIGPYDGIITTASEPRTRTHHSYSGFRWYTGYTGDPETADEFLRLAPAATSVAWQLQGGDRDFVLTPSGTGKVRFGEVEAAGDGSGESLVLGIKDAGATARKVAIADSRAGVYNVLAYGADPTGATDSTAAFQAAAAAINAAAGGRLLVPCGRFVITATVAFTVGNVELELHPDAVIDTSQSDPAATYAAVEFGAVSVLTTTTVSADIAEGDADITVASTVGFEPGDMIAITSDDEYWGGITGSSGFGRKTKGELAFVRDVPDGTTLTLERLAGESYSTAVFAVSVARMARIDNVKVRGGTFIGIGGGNAHTSATPTGFRAMNFRGCRGVEVTGVTFRNFPRFAVYAALCDSFQFHHCILDGRDNTDATNLPSVSPWFTGAYFTGSNNVDFSHNQGFALRRHYDADSAGVSTGMVIGRNHQVHGNSAHSCGGAVGCHAVRGLKVSNCSGTDCGSGLGFRGRDLDVSDCVFAACSGNGISLGGATNMSYSATESPNVGTVRIRGVRCDCAALGLSVVDDIDALHMDGNHFRCCTDGTSYAAYMLRQLRARNVSIGSNDVIDLTGALHGAIGISFRNDSSVRLVAENITLRPTIRSPSIGVTFTGAAVASGGAENVEIDCTISDATESGVDFLPAAAAVNDRLASLGEHVAARVTYQGQEPTRRFGYTTASVRLLTSRRPTVEWVLAERQIGYGLPSIILDGETVDAGDKITDPATGAEYVCRTSGTGGDDGGATVTIDAGNTDGTLTAGGLIARGQRVTIVGAGAGGSDLSTRVTYKSGADISIADAAATSVVAAHLNFNNPVWTARGSARHYGHSDLAHTGDTTETILATIQIPAGSLGANGEVRVHTVWTYTNSANAKTMRLRLGASGAGTGGTVLYESSPTTTQGQTTLWHFRNMNDASVQRSQNRSATSYGASGTGPSTAAIDTTADAEIVLTAQLADAGETITLRAYEVEIIYRD